LIPKEIYWEIGIVGKLLLMVRFKINKTKKGVKTQQITFNKTNKASKLQTKTK
jgi:hypothetical protein